MGLILTILSLFILSSCHHEENIVIKKQQKDYIEYKKQIEEDFNTFLIKAREKKDE